MAEQGHGKHGGFFPTPMNICTMMAAMVHSDRERSNLLHDPCVGTGRLLLAGSNYCLRLFGQDINWLCILASKINLALFAPWHLIPTSFFSADTASEVSERQTVQELPTETSVYTTEMEQLTLF